MLTPRTLVIVVASCAVAAVAFTSCRPPTASADPAAKIERGRYLVENVGMCADCHTPHGPDGIDKTRWLQGSPLAFAPTVPIPTWIATAPAIAGMPGYTRESAIVFLSEGRTLQGKMSNPPMPSFRFSRSDAEAVYSYLVSLKNH